jgi:ribonucleoside-diphosphate reductase alpha chain
MKNFEEINKIYSSSSIKHQMLELSSILSDLVQIEPKIEYFINQSTTQDNINHIIEKVSEGYALDLEEDFKTFAEYVSQTCYYMAIIHPDYAKLASRYMVYYIHQVTSHSFKETIRTLANNVRPKDGKIVSLINDELYEIVMEQDESFWQDLLNYHNDYQYDYFGLCTLIQGRLMTDMQGCLIERPQHMLLRVVLGIHGRDFDMVRSMYKYASEMYFTYATPTLFNSGTKLNQLASCFLYEMYADSIEGIYDTLKTSALISKNSGGIGIAIHRIRACGSIISGTNGTSNGIVPMLRVYNDTARYCDQGGGKRKGSFAIYLEPWHADIFEFLDLRKPSGVEEHRARDLFYGLWIPDLFMERVYDDGKWSLFCPNVARGLHRVYGDEFRTLYEKYESECLFENQIDARTLWNKIIISQIEFGFPYMLYKDAANLKSNQMNLGTIQSSNLCTETIIYSRCEESDPDNNEIAVCNLSSISLPAFVNLDEFGCGVGYDFQKLFNVAYMVTKSLDRVIDVTYYCVEAARRSNLRHRPIGVGAQGLADVFHLLHYPFTSDKAKQLNRDIFETIYFACLTASNDLARKDGPYETFWTCPAAEGRLQYHLWGYDKPPQSTMTWDWDTLIESIKLYGLKNSLLTAQMPTASSSQILGNCESIEPYTDNLYTRKTLSGNFYVVNPHLINDLQDIGLWNDSIVDQILENGGSVREIVEIPEWIKEQYRTVWEIKQRDIIDMSADRALYICQSQSLNIFMDEPTLGKVSSMHFYGWKKGLKTGMYYLRTKPITQTNRLRKRSTQKDDTAIIVPGEQQMFMRMEERKEKEKEKEKEEEDDYCIMCQG